MAEQKPVLSVRISQETMDWLVELEERTGVGRAEIVERCLTIGMADQSQLLKWLESPVAGPLFRLLSHPVVLNAIVSLTGDEVDSASRKMMDGVKARRGGKGKTKAKPA